MGRKRRKILVLLVMVVLLGVAAYAGGKLYTSQRAYAQGDETYEELAQLVIRQEPTEEPEPEAASAPEPDQETAESTGEESPEPSLSQATEEAPKLDIPALSVDFDALKAVSSDAIGWLYCPDTVIDYPVMEAEDYTYYLRHLPDGTYNINGSLFLDYGCAPDFSDKLSVIYGHNMKTEKMFGTLVNYKNQTYFDAHPYLYLYTETGNYRIALIYGAVVSADRWSQGNFAQDPEGLLEYAAANTTFVSPESGKIAEDQRLVVLSTCSYEYENARYFVVGLLQPEK
jgi:sortase B